MNSITLVEKDLDFTLFPELSKYIILLLHTITSVFSPELGLKYCYLGQPMMIMPWTTQRRHDTRKFNFSQSFYLISAVLVGRQVLKV